MVSPQAKFPRKNAYLITICRAHHAAPINHGISKNLSPGKTINQQAMV